MALTNLEELLIRGLLVFRVSRENIPLITVLLESDEDKCALIDYMAEHQEATEQDILAEVWKIRKIHQVQPDIGE